MKNPKYFMLLTAICIVWVSCSKIEDDFSQESINQTESPDWVQALSGLDARQAILVVGQGGLLQEAIDAAGTDALIFIEPGEYRETIRLTRPDVQLVAAGLSADEPVIVDNPGGESLPLMNAGELKSAQGGIVVRREDLGGRVAHYTMDVIMGTGPYDLVRIHRVVKEKKAYWPVHTRGNVFMVHGAIQDFDDIFLTGGAEVVDAATSAPYYLAAHGIDVWGIDLAWNRVPIESGEGFEFMKDWGVEKDIGHVLRSLAIARLVRGFTHQGFGPMNLLGFSYGVPVVYGAAGSETQMPRCCRNIKGLIPVDSPMKTDDPEAIAAECAAAALQMEKWNAGEYNNPWGVDFIGLGQVVLANPNGHEIHPDLTNLQIMNAALTDHSEGWHFLGGTPFALTYTDSMRLPRMSVNLAPHQPRLQFYEIAACACPDLDVSFDDYLDQVSLPILYISAEGSDNSNDYTAELTQTTDYERLHVADPDPAVPEELNFCHADLWLGYDAPQWVWEPLYRWLLTH